jgi:hypothetical protein
LYGLTYGQALLLTVLKLVQKRKKEFYRNTEKLKAWYGTVAWQLSSPGHDIELTLFRGGKIK